MIRRPLRTFLAAAFLLPAIPTPAQEPIPQRHVVAVLDFAEQGEISPGSGQVAAELLEIALVQTGRFQVVERSRLASVTSELELGLTGMVSEETAQRIGEIVGAEVIIAGSVYRVEGVTGLNTKLIATRDASIITADSARSIGRTTLDALVEQILPSIIEDFPLRGYVIERTGGTAMIDLGANVGLIPGREFKVYTPGKELRSPVTNEILHREEIDKGMLEVVEVFKLSARCRITSEATPGAIANLDLIKSIGFELDEPERAEARPASPPPAAAPAPTTAAPTWKAVTGAPTMLLTQVDNQSGGPAYAFGDALRTSMAEELAKQGVASPVLTDLPGNRDGEDIAIPSEYAGARPYLMRLLIKDFEFDRDGDAEVHVVCRVYDPRADEVILKKGFDFERDGKDYGDRDELLAKIRSDVVAETIRLLQNRLR